MLKQTSISYNPDVKILTFNPSAWNAVAPLQWFNNYKIISLVDNPLAKTLNIISLKGYFPQGVTLPATNREMRTSLEAKQLVQDYQLEDYWRFYNYALPAHADEKALANDSAVAAKFENKVWLRETLGSELRFAPFFIPTLDELKRSGFEGCLERLDATALVVQHPSQSGGRGTYRVRTQEAFDECLVKLAETLDGGDKLVVSKALARPQERTIQACVANGRVLVGPAQAQLVGHPLLVSMRQGDIQFCGGRIDEGLLSDAQYRQAYQAAQVVGYRLMEEGYKGIFGMDFLVSDGELYVLEANPRLTGLSTLLAFIQHDMPFLLLHTLEHTNSPYEMIQREATPDGTGSYIQVYAQQDGTSNFTTGRYDGKGNRLGEGFENGSILPDSLDEYFVGMRVSPGAAVKQAKSLAFIYSRKQLFADDGTIDPDVIPLVNKIRS